MEDNIEKPATPRPGDPFTAQDATYLYALINRMMKEIKAELEMIRERLAVQQKNHIDMLELLNVIESGLSESRVGRLEIEVMETELEKELAERQLRAVEEKLNRKQAVKDQQIDTHEKIKQAAAVAYADLEKKRKEADEAYRLEVKRGIIKAVLQALAVSATFGTIAFVWWLIQMYVNR